MPEVAKIQNRSEQETRTESQVVKVQLNFFFSSVLCIVSPTDGSVPLKMENMDNLLEYNYLRL